MLNQQLVLPGVSLDELESIKDPKFTYGIEIEVTEFDNGQGVTADSSMGIKDKRTGICYDAFTTSRPVRKDKWDWIPHDFEIKVSRRSVSKTERSLDCEIDSADWLELSPEVQNAWVRAEKELPTIELNPDGSLPDGWEEVPHSRDWHPNHSEESAISQSKALLNENGLSDWDAIFDESLRGAEIDGVELVSPVFKEGETNSIHKVCNLFQNCAKVDHWCGLHIHIGIEDYDLSLDQLKLLAMKWIQAEEILLGLPFYKDDVDLNCPLFVNGTLEFRSFKDERSLSSYRSS